MKYLVNPGFSVKLTIIPRAVGSISLQAGVAARDKDRLEGMALLEEER